MWNSSERDHLRRLAEVLGSNGELELAFWSMGIAQTQAVQLRDKFESGEVTRDLRFPATLRDMR